MNLHAQNQPNFKNYIAKNPDTTILIVGAGLTGLTLACDLARRGIEFRIVEKSPVYFTGSRGKTLQPRSLEVFDDLGVIDQLLEHGRFHLMVRNYDGDKVLWDRDIFSEGQYPTPAIPYASGLFIPQFQIERTLREFLKKYDKEVELGVELTALKQDTEGVSATVNAGGAQKNIRCKYLVAADGGRSFVRKYLNVDFAGETIESIGSFAGDVKIDGLDHEHMHVWNKHCDGYVSLTPFKTTSIFQFQASAPLDFKGAPTLNLFQQIFNERSGITKYKFYDATWLSFYKTNIRMVNQYRTGRVFLGGDAAHIHSPAGGQGMNTGIQDAYNLGWKLEVALVNSDPEVLDTYETERLPVARSVLGISTQLMKNFQGGNKELPAGTDTLQLGINYRKSLLSQQACTVKLQAGDRAPDAPLSDNEGKTFRLFDLFRGPHFTLLFVNNTVELRTVCQQYKNVRAFQISYKSLRVGKAELSDIHGHFENAYGLEKDIFYLIRPDGYIGMIGNDNSILALIEYLNRFCFSNKMTMKIMTLAQPKA